MEGYEIDFEDHKAKVIPINHWSVLGRYIRMMVHACEKPDPTEEYNLLLSVVNRVDKSKRKATVYKMVDGRKAFLYIPKEFERDLNEFFQKMFENSFFNFVEGYRQQEYLGAVRDGIRLFIEKYNLYEVGYTYAALEQTYMRMRRTKHQLQILNKQPRY